MRILSSALSDVGLQRSGNEDSFLADNQLALYMVADGMGGHAAGEVASNSAVATVGDLVRRATEESGEEDGPDPSPSGWPNVLKAAVREANRNILRLGRDNPAYAGMGTTLSAVFVRGACAVVAHVGDSRVYRMRGGRFEAVTADHSWVGERIQQNLLPPEAARTHHLRNIITRALGNGEALEVDLLELELRPDDCFLLCSDGLWEPVADAEMAAVLERMDEDLEGACRRLVEAAKQAGGPDNITLVILRVME